MTESLSPTPVAPPKTVLDFLRENWPWVASLVYVYVTAIGMVQAWFQYRAFDLNVFEFSDLNDFLLAAFREPTSFLAVLGLVAYGALGIPLSMVSTKVREQRGAASSGLPVYFRMLLHGRMQKWVMYGIFVLMVVIAPYSAPMYLHDGYGEKWKGSVLADAKRVVHVQLKDIKTVKGPEGWIRSVVLIGITAKFVFLYVPKTKRLLIVPLTNLIAMAKE
jgi:hypothetical protein